MAYLQIQQSHLNPLWLTLFRNTEFRKPYSTDSETELTTWADRSPKENTDSAQSLARLSSMSVDQLPELGNKTKLNSQLLNSVVKQTQAMNCVPS